MADSVLITGPPASGKSRLAVERFLTHPDSLLLTPTATMAEHVRNELARAGALVRPNRILTLAHFLEDRTVGQATPSVLRLVIRESLERLRPPRFASVDQYSGVHAAIAGLIEEVPPDAAGGDLASLFQEIERDLAARGLTLRRARIETAARDPGKLPLNLVFDGFFSFAPAELRLIQSMAAVSSITITLPDWSGGATSRARLLSMGFIERKCSEVYRKARVEACSAPTVVGETEEIARRILEAARRGRAFREMGIILRVRDPYAAMLETTLARFGIPARFYFADPLIAHPAVAYLAGIVQAMLDGWPHATLLKLLRMPVSGLGATQAGDSFDFAMRERLPGAGLPLPVGDLPPAIIESLNRFEAWRHDAVDASEWAVRLKRLVELLPESMIADRVSRQQVQIWRSTAAALQAFEAALDETAAALAGAGRIGVGDFWRQADVTLQVNPLRVPDRRRNVVHVLDVLEARQWELPLVFVCGLVERHFPQYHREDPFLGDAARRRAGLATSTDLQGEEEFLFKLATTRATDETILSYARFDDQGEETLPSFFLQRFNATPCETRVQPRPSRGITPPGQTFIQDAELRDRLAQAHKRLSPTSIESFLQCPFQFFAAKTLRLRLRPPAPRDRLDALLQGSILHRALAELARMPLLGSEIFDQVFADECRRARVPLTYRTEAVRVELLRHFEAFVGDRQVALSWTTRVEEKFSFPLNPLLAIAGRSDRLDVGPQNQALVIDYKYSAGSKIRERVEQHASGNLVQGGLYLLAAERQFGLTPAGMLYCGLRKEVVWDGWHVPISGLEAIGESCTRARLKELMDTAAERAVASFESITSGRIAPEPADTGKCRWCDFRDICRVETAVESRKAGA